MDGDSYTVAGPYGPIYCSASSLSAWAPSATPPLQPHDLADEGPVNIEADLEAELADIIEGSCLCCGNDGHETGECPVAISMIDSFNKPGAWQSSLLSLLSLLVFLPVLSHISVVT